MGRSRVILSATCAVLLGILLGATALGAPHPLLIHNAGQHFPGTDLTKAYQAAAASKKLSIRSTQLAAADLTNWLVQAR